MFFTRVYLFSSPTSYEDEGMKSSIHFFYPEGSTDAQQLRTIGFAMLTESISDGEMFNRKSCFSPRHSGGYHDSSSSSSSSSSYSDETLRDREEPEEPGARENDHTDHRDQEEFQCSTIETEGGGVLALLALPSQGNAEKVRLGLEVQPYPRPLPSSVEEKKANCYGGERTSEQAAYQQNTKQRKMDMSPSGPISSSKKEQECARRAENKNNGYIKQQDYTWTPAHVHCWMRRLMHLCLVVAGDQWYVPVHLSSAASGSSSSSASAPLGLLHSACSQATAAVLKSFGMFLDAILAGQHSMPVATCADTVVAHVNRVWGEVARREAYFGFPTFFGCDNNNIRKKNDAPEQSHKQNDNLCSSPRIVDSKRCGLLSQPSMDFYCALQAAEQQQKRHPAATTTTSMMIKSEHNVSHFILFRREDLVLLRSSFLIEEEGRGNQSRENSSVPAMERYVFVSAVRLLLLISLFLERESTDACGAEKNDPAHSSPWFSFPFPLQCRHQRYRATVQPVSFSSSSSVRDATKGDLGDRMAQDTAQGPAMPTEIPSFLVCLYPLSSCGVEAEKKEEKKKKEPFSHWTSEASMTQIQEQMEELDRKDEVPDFDVVHRLNALIKRYGTLPGPEDAVGYRQQWVAHVEYKGASMIFGRILRSFPVFCAALQAHADHLLPLLRVLLKSKHFPLHDAEEIAEGAWGWDEEDTVEEGGGGAGRLLLPTEKIDMEWVVTDALCSGLTRCAMTWTTSPSLPMDSDTPSTGLSGSEPALKPCCTSRVTLMVLEALQARSFFDSMDDIEAFIGLLREKLFFRR